MHTCLLLPHCRLFCSSFLLLEACFNDYSGVLCRPKCVTVVADASTCRARMAKVYSSADARSLLSNKFIVFIGSSGKDRLFNVGGKM